MSARTVLSAASRLQTQRFIYVSSRRDFHALTRNGILRSTAGPRIRLREGGWPSGAYSIHNLPAVRTISFARVLPKLATKLLTLPAMGAGATVAGLVYIQYQAQQAGTYALDFARKTGESVGGTALSLFGSAKTIADQTWLGIERTKDSAKELGLSDWMSNMFGNDGTGSESGGDGNGGPGQQPPKQSRSKTAAAVTGAALGYTQSSEDDPRPKEQVAKDDQMMILTKKMIEIRNILSQVGQSGALTLPSIVVIGSQSSGKSSVLEAIVGHEFLPKGSNMVTRRPIELTLINTPGINTEYGEFTQLGLGKITDFSQIQKTLTDLNLAVPASECVSDDPIRLSIYSPNVPDLSLIDLPGYIQVVGSDQPLELKQKISDLCDKYIQPPNVILAISAADVDLANSTALRASRRVDPRGERTIGVITKMDLVEADRGASILTDKKYPLRLGYVGVVSKVPQQTGLFTRNTGNITSIVTKNENAYFTAHSEFGADSGLAVGTTTLRKKLMHVLENTMAASLQTTIDAIRLELEEASYEFKVQYNDRPLSADSYLAEALDAFKHSFKAFAETFGRPQVRELLKAELDQRVLDLLAQRYWNKPITELAASRPDLNPLSTLAQSGEESTYWTRQLDASSSALTKLGIGRLATTVTANALQSHIEDLIAKSSFATHPFARDAIANAASGILNERFYSTSDQVENCIKPFKYEIDIDDNEWIRSRQMAAKSLRRELQDCEVAEKSITDVIGGKRKLKDVVSFIDRIRNGEVVLEGDGSGGAGGFSALLLQKGTAIHDSTSNPVLTLFVSGREAVFLRDRADIIRMRLLALKSKACSSYASGKYKCPEVFLDVVADKLTSTAVLFLNVELLSEFYYHFPRELDARLGKGLSEKEVDKFAREDGRVASHLDVIRRKELLELVLEKCNGLKGLEDRVNRDDRARKASNNGGSKKGDNSGGGWKWL